MKTLTIAKVLIVDSQNDALVMHRSSTHPTLAHQPDLPGGLIEPGEEPGEALLREVVEETGLTLQFDQLRLVYTGVQTWENENRVRLLYVTKLDEAKPDIHISWEHADALWLPLSDLPSIEHEYNHFYKEGLAYIRENEILKDL
jgi:8-oxo-dGTP diphosphatase